MTLHWALDTESGGTSQGTYEVDGVVRVCGEDLRNRVITYAPLRTRKLSDVRCICAEPDENVYDLFWRKLKNAETETRFVFHVWNLNWEAKPLYTWFHDFYHSHGGAPEDYPRRVRTVVTEFNWYSLSFRLDGLEVTFVDDCNHLHASVDDAVKNLMKDPVYRQIIEENGLYGKEKDRVENLHEIWYCGTPEEKETYLHYSKVDAFCQALIMEELFSMGRFVSPYCYGDWMTDMRGTALSASGAGFRDAKSRIIYNCGYADIPHAFAAKIEAFASRKSKSEKGFENAVKGYTAQIMGKWLDDKWSSRMGLLRLEEQWMVENNLRGGFVWAVPGRWKGRFYHFDYKSSYPYEYVFGKLPVSNGLEEECSYIDSSGERKTIKRPMCMTPITPDELQHYVESEEQHWLVYVEVCFSFELKEGALPLITLKETDIEAVGWDRSRKLRTGRTRRLLMTWEEWMLVVRLYTLWDIEMSGSWLCRAKKGFYRRAVEEYFDGKEHSTGVERALHKLDLNGATHGRPMIRMMTAPDVILDGVDEVKVERNISELDLTCNPLQGFTAMSNARVRLVSQCMDLIDAGFQIYMCDTDSMITDCPPLLADSIWEQKGWRNRILRRGMKGMDETLGMLEVETDRNGKESFDEMMIWGLKRYVEIDEGHYRKSAFAGMHKEDQEEILMKREDFMRWQSTSKKWMGECYAIRYHTVEAGMEDIFYD